MSVFTPPAANKTLMGTVPAATNHVGDATVAPCAPELQAVQDLNRARQQGRRLVERWLVVAESLLATPDKLSGKELNRAAELILAANAWIREELSRAKREHANAIGTHSSYVRTPVNGGAK